MIGAATLDRLRHGAHKIVLDGESYRGLKPASKRPEPSLQKETKSSNLDPRSNPRIARFRWGHYGGNARCHYAER